MSEQEEPVAKLAKLEGSMESMDEGQEEWLSEGVLTDDDGNPMADNDSSAVQSQDETMESEPALEEPTEKLEEPTENKKKDKENGAELNTDKIAEALDNMENEKTDKNEDDMQGDLSTFLVRKTDGTIVETKERREDTDMESPRHSDETDANDTDELLRMLGDDDQKAKKKKEVRKIAEKKTKDDQSTDEEEVFTGKMTRLKSKLTKKIPTKAVPEVTSDDESTNLKSRLRTPKKPILRKTPVKTKSGGSDQENITPKVKGVKKIATKAVPEVSDDDNVLSIAESTAQTNIEQKTLTGTEHGQIQYEEKENILLSLLTSPRIKSTLEFPLPGSSQLKKRSSDDKNVMKKMFTTKKKVHFAAKSTAKPDVNKYSAQAQREIEASKRLEALKNTQKPAVEVKEEQDIRAEEFLDEDLFDLDEYGEDVEMRGSGRGSGRGAGRGARQPMMRPERMEEESLSDGDSTSDNSYYDDLPSTDSEEDLEDWFTFDIRAERAGDYLPLLGDKAHQILSEERARLAGRVSSLRHDLAAAATAARAHATSLRRAAAVVAELDASIKAAV